MNAQSRLPIYTLALCCALFLTGCAQTTTDNNAGLGRAPVSPNQVTAGLPADGSWPTPILRPRSARFEFQLTSQANSKPKEVAFDVRWSTDESVWNQMTETLGESIYRIGPNGSIRLVADNDSAEEVEVRYDPPMHARPPQTTLGSRASAKSTMTVYNLDGSVRDKGTCEYTVESLGTRKVETPAGMFDTVVVRTTRKIDLKLATVQVVIDTAIAPGVGMVAENVRQNIRALGLFPIIKTHTLKLVSENAKP